MNNVGDTKTFILNGNAPTQPMRFVWKWWDGSVDVTNTGTVTKELNLGGNPADGFQVRFSCEAVNEVGASSVFNGALVVNNPPSVALGSASLSQNGNDFQYHTVASLVAYDLENDPIKFNWTAGGVPLGSGSSHYIGQVAGTYAGTFAGFFNGTSNSIGYDVNFNGSLVVEVSNPSGGTTAIPFFVFGQSPAHHYSAPQISYFQTTVDAASDPNVRIGVAEYAAFAVFTAAHPNPTDFLWTFYGTNGWNHTTTSNGTTTLLADGALRNTALKLTAGETPGPKIAECRILDEVTKIATIVKIPAFLVADNPPVIVSTLVLPDSPLSGDILSFEVNGTDADGDLLYFRWAFPGLGQTLYGRKVFVDSSPIIPGQPVQANLTVTDRLGLSVSQVVQSQVLS